VADKQAASAEQIFGHLPGSIFAVLSSPAKHSYSKLIVSIWREYYSEGRIGVQRKDEIVSFISDELLKHAEYEARFPPERLQFEITEGYLLANPERVVRAVETFKERGMSIALDDFGTGFTSIHYLRSYGFSHIKIDKSLLDGLAPGSKGAMLVTGAIMLACGLDMRVIAEGVETEEQAQLLRQAGCHKLQGYLFGKPMPLADFVAAWERSERTVLQASARFAG